MTQNLNRKKKNDPNMQTAKKWVLRISFSVTISYLHYIILPHTLVWQTLSLTPALWLDFCETQKDSSRICQH